MITYASGKNADIIIWVVRKAREEHRSAIEWLNNHTDEQVSFFLCEIKLYKIGESDPAVKFDVIEKPNAWTRNIKRSECTSETQQSRMDYWIAFNEYAFKNVQFAKDFKQRKPSKDHWMNFSIGTSDCCMSVSQIKSKNVLDIEIYIWEDKELFYALYEKKTQIEVDSGLVFDWRELPEKKASRIVIEHPARLDDKSKWKEQFDWIMDTMIKMKKAFKKHL